MAPPAKLRNIGPKSAAQLRQVGVRSLEDLRALGSLEAFVKLKRAGFKPSLNLLYSLEGALLDCHWQDVPDGRRSELYWPPSRQCRAAQGTAALVLGCARLRRAD